MLRSYYLNNSTTCKEEEYYFIINNSTLIFPFRRTSASALKYVEYYMVYNKSRICGDLEFIDIFPEPSREKCGEFVKINNKFFIMLDEGSIYV